MNRRDEFDYRDRSSRTRGGRHLPSRSLAPAARGVARARGRRAGGFGAPARVESPALSSARAGGDRAADPRRARARESAVERGSNDAGRVGRRGERTRRATRA